METSVKTVIKNTRKEFWKRLVFLLVITISITITVEQIDIEKKYQSLLIFTFFITTSFMMLRWVHRVTKTSCPNCEELYFRPNPNVANIFASKCYHCGYQP